MLPSKDEINKAKRLALSRIEEAIDGLHLPDILAYTFRDTKTPEIKDFYAQIEAVQNKAIKDFTKQVFVALDKVKTRD